MTIGLRLSANKTDLESITKTLARKARLIEQVTEKTIKSRTDSLAAEVRSLMSSENKAVRVREGGFNQDAYSGLQVGEIGVETGRLRANLSNTTRKDGGVITGEVGYDKSIFNFTLDSITLSNRVNWPDNPKPEIKILRLIPSSYVPRTTAATLSEYLEEVLLGNGDQVGRNVLRWALVNDINKGVTMKTLSTNIKKVLPR